MARDIYEILKNILFGSSWGGSEKIIRFVHNTAEDRKRSGDEASLGNEIFKIKNLAGMRKY